MLIINLVISIILQSGSIAKKNGEIIRFSDISVYQERDTKAKSLTFSKGNRLKTIEISELRRINFKESIGKSKGVTRWLAVLVEKNNVKHEVEIELHEIRGVNSDGEEFSLSANTIDKISF
ncbi:MAG: hypothetical protein GDA42_12060 [Ekhidna sp.]|nr:hypothetical protein [Ekhidna sp.]MBC6411162.1 hypothetical protein [Ekhidna sp.]